MANVSCPKCHASVQTGTPSVRFGGLCAGAATGSSLASSLGIVLGPIGMMSGILPGALIGGTVGYLGARKLARCGACKILIQPPVATA